MARFVNTADQREMNGNEIKQPFSLWLSVD